MRFLLCIITFLFLSTQAYAFDIGLSLNQNIYNNGRLNDAPMLSLQLEHNDAHLFLSYEQTYMRLMGLSAAEYGILGVGVGYGKGNLRLSTGYYFVNADTIYSKNGLFNEAIYLYLVDKYGYRLWDNYEVQASGGVGFSIGWHYKYLFAGYRFLRLPIKVIGWDTGYKGDSTHGWWHSIEKENLSCAFVGIKVRF